MIETDRIVRNFNRTRGGASALFGIIHKPDRQHEPVNPPAGPLDARFGRRRYRAVAEAVGAPLRRRPADTIQPSSTRGREQDSLPVLPCLRFPII